MNLVLPGIIDERVADDRSQWFTTPAIAWRMACLVDSPPSGWRILEPSAGSGNLVEAIVKRAPFCEVTAIESDPYYADVLAERFATECVDVLPRDYLSQSAPIVPYDLTLMNSPFEDGIDGKFLAKAMAESMRVIALIRLVAVAGKARHEEVWSQVGDGKPWTLRGLHIFAGRPRFIAGRAIGAREDDGSTKADFCVVNLSCVPGETGTEVEWW